jgi:hypothetical protein
LATRPYCIIPVICILKMTGQEISGWLIAHDIDEARRAAEFRGGHELAAALYRVPFPVPTGKREICPGFIMLVD